MEDFSISGDITPLRGTYFSNTLTSGERSSLRGRESQSISSHMSGMIKIMEAMDRKRDRDLRYQMNLEAIQHRRDAAQQERDAASRLNDLSKTLYGITTSNDSVEDRAGMLEDLRLSNPSLFASQGSAALYSAASQKLNRERQNAAKEEAKEKAEADRLATLYSDPTKLGEKYAEGGINQFEAANLEAVNVLSEQTQSKAQKDWALKNLDSQEKNLKAIEKILTSVGEQDGNQWETKGEFNTQDRKKLEFALLQMGEGALTIADVRSMSGDKLYDDVLNRYQIGLQGYHAAKQRFAPPTTNTNNTNNQGLLRGVPR